MLGVIKECLPTYQVQEVLGEGIYGTVYKISDGLKERAAKVVPLVVERSRSYNTPADLDSKISQDFHAVREYYEKIEGPGVLKVHDFHLVGKSISDAEARAHLVILMELCRRNLRDHVLERPGGLAPAEALGLMRDLAAVLKRLSQDCGETFVVTDLKPSNLLFNQSGELLVGDLGGLKRLGSVSSTATAQYTPNWSAPETILRAEKPGVAAIIYAYGLVSFFIWEGCLPFEKEDFVGRIRLVKENGVSFTRSDVPEGAVRLIQACLAFDPSGRPDGFGAVMAALDRVPDSVAPGAEGSARPGQEPGGLRTVQADKGDSSSQSGPPGAPRYGVCPACGKKTRLPKGIRLSRVACPDCGKPLAPSFGFLLKLYATSAGLCLMGWALAGTTEIFFAHLWPGWRAGWAAGWALGGLGTALGLSRSVRGMGRANLWLVAAGWALAGAVTRMDGPSWWIFFLWPAAWAVGSLVTGVAVRDALPRLTLRDVLAGTFGWTVALAVCQILAAMARPWAGTHGQAGMLLAYWGPVLQKAVVELVAALAGFTILFFQIRSAQTPVYRREVKRRD